MARRDTVDQPPADPGLPFKRRARRRLVGALVIGLGVAVTLPFVLDREPRYPRPDIRVDIPSRDAQLPVRIQNEADTAAPPGPRAPVSAEAARAARAEAGRAAESRDASAGASAPDAARAAADARQPPRAPMVQQLDAPNEASGAARSPTAPRPDPEAARAAAAKAEAARLEAQRQEAARVEAAKASAARAEAARQDTLRQEAARQEAIKQEAIKQEAARQEAARAQAAAAARVDPPRPPADMAARALPSQNWAVQIGQFARPENARAAEARASGLGLRAYSETLQTAQGERVRVRAGPFATRAAAEEARSRLIAAGLEAALIAPEAPR
jgi:DedD protein